MIIKSVVGRPTTIFILFVLLFGFGLYAALDLAIDLYPEVTPPILLVFTNYEGTGPEEIERSVTRPLEGALGNVSNIDTITSVSSEGSSQITIQFVWGTDMSEASNDVRDMLEFVKDILPPEASTPMIFKFDPSMIPILELMLKGNRSPEELRDISERIVVPRLEQVSGVAMASTMGGRESVVRVEIPQSRLEAYNLTLTQVAQTLRGQNVQISAGSITEGSRNYLIRTAGEYRSLEELRNTVIAYKGSGARNPDAAMHPIRLRDIANVFDGYARETTNVFINGQPGVYISVQKQSGTNSVRTADNVLERLVRINQALPRGVSVEVISDTTNIIRSSLTQVSNSAASGALLAVIILFFFLRSFRSTLIIAISIPVSIVVTLMLMYFFDLTLNLMTLTGLALGIGMLVDNSIVILENIYRYREKGTKLKTSAILGGAEMTSAIIASTLTTIVVFAPLALFKDQLGFMGEMFASLSFTIVISLTSSLVVALVLVPVLTSRYLPIAARSEEPLTGLRKRLDDFMAAFFTWIDNGYKKRLSFITRHRVLPIMVIALIFVGSLFLIPMTGFEFMPDFQQDIVTINVELPIGTRLDITESVLRQLEQIVKQEVHGYKNIIISAGQRSFFGFLGATQSHRGLMHITLPPFRERIDSSDVVREKLRAHFNDFPGAVFSFGQGGGFGNANPIDILIRSDDLVKGKLVGEQIRDILKNDVPQATEPTMNLQDGLPQIEVVIDRDKAYDLGLNIFTIGQEIRANVDGILASKFRAGTTEEDILVILDENDRNTVPDLNRIFVTNPAGRRIPLASFASLERSTGPVNINRENQSRTIRVTAGVKPGTDLNSTEMLIRGLIAERIPADDELVIEFSGEYADLMTYGTRIIFIFLISVALVFGIMASLFESFLDPFIIIFTIPLTAIGVILIHVMLGINFSMFTAVGMVVLAGIVVNNGIVLVDYTNLLRKRGMSIRDAVIEAGGHRLRPVLMTTLTTVLALVPLAISRGEGIDLIRPIGVTILGGLTISTFFTLFLVPVIYTIFNEMSEKRAVKREVRLQKRLESRKRYYAALEQVRQDAISEGAKL